jgi:hypothetical protein
MEQVKTAIVSAAAKASDALKATKAAQWEKYKSCVLDTLLRMADSGSLSPQSNLLIGVVELWAKPAVVAWSNELPSDGMSAASHMATVKHTVFKLLKDDALLNFVRTVALAQPHPAGYVVVQAAVPGWTPHDHLTRAASASAAAASAAGKGGDGKGSEKAPEMKTGREAGIDLTCDDAPVLSLAELEARSKALALAMSARKAPKAPDTCYSVYQVTTDGSCLFASLARVLGRPKDVIKSGVREMISSMNGTPEWAYQLQNESRPLTQTEYLARFDAVSFNGGSPELVAACHAFDIRIAVFLVHVTGADTVQEVVSVSHSVVEVAGSNGSGGLTCAQRKTSLLTR